MATKVTMSEIAKALGVSTVTVSRAIAGKEGVGEAMRERILRTAAELGYQSKPSAGLQPDSDTVGILISCRFIGKGHTFYWNLYERVLSCLAEHDIFGILEPVSVVDEAQGVLPRMVRTGRVQALLLIGQLGAKYRQGLAVTGLPMVQLDTWAADAQLDSVISDSYHGMCQMTDYLLRRGHRKIAYVGSVGATTSITDRYFGCCRALTEWGLTMRPDWVIADREENERVTIQLPAEMPTAFVCNCDETAYHLLQQLEKCGYRVPDDVSLVGFDNFSLYPITPELTTYAVDMEAMTRASTAQLFARMEGSDAPPVLQIVPGHLIEGGSVKPL